MISNDDIKIIFENLYQFDKHGHEALVIAKMDFSKFLYISPAIEPIWGCTCQSLHDDPKSFFKVIHPADRFPVERELFDSRFVEGEFEYRIVPPGKNLRWIHEWVFPIKDGEGRILWKASKIRDVSSQLFTEKMLQLREQRYRAVFNSGYDAIFVCNFRKFDLSDTFIEFNENAVRWTGFSRNELEHMCIGDLIERSERQRLPEIVEHLFSRQNLLFETVISSKTGKPIPVEINANLFSFINQPAMMLIVRDISERKALETQKKEYQRKLENEVEIQTRKLLLMNSVLAQEILDREKIDAELKKSQEEYRLLVENQTDLVIKTDPTGRFMFVSPSYCTWFGKTREELMGKPFTPKDEHSGEQDNYNGMDQLHLPPHTCSVEQHINTAFGKRWLAWSGKAVLDHKNQVLAVVWVGRDITSLKESAEQIKYLSRRLMKSIEDDRKKLALEIHDEIGQSVTVIHMELDSLNKMLPRNEPGWKTAVEKIMGHIQNLGDIVRTITARLRPDMLDSMGLIPALKWYVKELSSRFPGLNIEFVTRGIKNVQFHPDVEIVAYRIIQEGLLNTAEHANADHAHVLITYSHPNLIIKIMDNGVGFDPEEAFLKAISRKHGLGLVSMRERAASLGGKVTVRSMAGKGTVIRGVIPMEKGGAA